MAYGLKIINDASELLIDSDFVNPTFVQKMEFNTTPTYIEASDGRKHPGFIRRDYSTALVNIGTGKYIVLWALPDSIVSGQAEKDVWYQFSTSEATNNLSFDCSVYANSQGTPISYSLPTAYVFTIDAAGVNALYSGDAYGLRMYNSSSVKTFDSNFTQLAPTYVSNNYTIPTGEQYTPLYMQLTMVNPILLLPKTALMFASPNGFSFTDYKVFDVVYRRRGQYLDTRMMSTSFETEDYNYNISGILIFPAGTFDNLTVIAADGDLYQASGAGSQTGANPNYLLQSNYSTVNEGETFVITLTTTLVANGTSIPYTVTGIDGADLIVGGLSGSFVIQSNTATASFTVKNDLSLENTETFILTLQGINSEIRVSILDTSKPAAVYSFGAVSGVDEGSTTGSVNFQYQYAAGKSVSFAIVAPTAGVTATSADVSLNSTSTAGLAVGSTNNAAGTFAVGYNVAADTTTEGLEYFRISATVDNTTYYSDNIQINDTSLTAVGYSITASNNWLESSTGNVANVTATGVNGVTLYFTTDNALVVPQTTSATSNSNSYSINVSYNVGLITSSISVTLEVRTGRANGAIVASKVVSIANTNPTYSFGAVSSINEGSTGSVQFNYSNSAGVSFGFSATSPSSGEQNDGSDDVVINTSSFTVGSTDAAGTVSVSYSVGADLYTDGSEYFRIQALVNGVYYTSDDILINDTSKSRGYSVSTAGTWTESSTSNAVTISATNANGLALYLTSSNPTVAYVTTGYATSWTASSDSFSATTYFTAGNVLTSTNVTLYLRTGSASGPAVAETTFTIGDSNPQFSWATSPLLVNEGVTGSLVFNFSEAAGVTFSWYVYPPTGGVLDGSEDVSISTDDYTVGGSDAAGSVTVSYSTGEDSFTEGTEYFRLVAYANGGYYYSSNIAIGDTSTTPIPAYGISANSPPWNENTTQSTSVTLTNVSGYTYYPTSDNTAVTCQTTSFYVSSNSFTTTLYWTVGAVTADTTVNLYLRRSRSNGSIDASTSVTVKNILPSGTIISEGCLAYGTAPYTYRVTTANGSGGSTNTDTNNSTACGYVAPPTYSLARSTSSVNENGSFSITFSTNQTGSFAYTITGVSSADLYGASLTGSVSNGDVLSYSLNPDQITEGTETFTITLNNGLATQSVTILDSSVWPASGTVLSEGCLPGTYTYRKVIANGSGGSTNQDTANSTSCGYVAPPAAGTILSEGCVPGTTTYRVTRANGSGGSYDTDTANSTSCGYVAPSYSLGGTWTELANGAAGIFYVRTANASGVTLTPSISGAGASRVSISPTSRTASGNSSQDLTFTVTATLPTSNVAAQSVTISVQGLSFTFTIQAYAPVAAAPTVTAIRVGLDETVYSGNYSYAIVTFSGPITSTTYFQVEFNLGSYAPYYNGGQPILNNYSGGQDISQSVYAPLGTSEAIIYTPTNPGSFNTTVRLRARSINASGSAITAFTSYTIFQYMKSGTIIQ
jgi:hypothetical protein